MTTRELVRDAVLLALVVLVLVWLACPERCAWRPERGLEHEYDEYMGGCLYDWQHAEHPEDMCNYKAAAHGLVRWVCR